MNTKTNHGQNFGGEIGQGYLRRYKILQAASKPILVNHAKALGLRPAYNRSREAIISDILKVEYGGIRGCR